MKNKMGLAIICLLMFGLASIPSASDCMNQAEAEQAYQSYLLSYASREGVLAPTEQAKAEMIANLMCKNQPAQATKPTEPDYSEKELSRNDTHIVIEVNDKGTIWTKTKPIQAYETPEVILSMTEQSALTSLEARVKLLEDKLARLCAMNITGAC